MQRLKGEILDALEALTGERFAIAFDGELPNDLSTPWLFGWSCNVWPELCGPHLRRRGRWDRWRRGFTLNVGAIARKHPQLRFARPRGRLWLVLLDVATHECAHAIDMQPSAEPADQEHRESRQSLAELTRLAYAGQRGEPELDVPFRVHGRSWLRVCCHLKARARAIGLDLDPLGNLAHYGLSEAGRYVDAIGDEPERFAGRPLDVLLVEPAPPDFERLWRADVVRAVRSLPLQGRAFETISRYLKSHP